jgi:alpha-galactosidase
MTRIAFIGAGSVVFTKDLIADLLAFGDLDGLELALHDIDGERLDTAEAIAHRIADQLRARSRVGISAHPDRREALAGADFVINMIQVGGIDATRRDFAIPAAYGLRQTIGDTLGIGGIFRALRTFPVLRDIARDMAALCPGASLLNYTNPMAMNVWYLSQIAPRLRVVGLCHSVYWTVVGLSELVGVPYDEVSYTAAGVNHQAWLLRWEREGRSLYPLLDERIAAYPQLRRRVRVDMYRRLGYYPTETSEHSSEYVGWYLHSDAEIARLRLQPSEYVQISEANVAEYEATRELLAAGGNLALDSASEYAPQVIHSMVTGTPRSVFGNVANAGLITNLPAGAGVEVPCEVDERGVRPTHVGDLPPQCAALNRVFCSVAELTVRAMLDEDPLMVRRAAMVDPNTSATLTIDDIWRLCEDLTVAHGDLVPLPLRRSCDLRDD